MKFGPNIAIFIVFFGLALVEAIQSKSWWSAILFLILGFLFLRADFTRKK